MFEKKTKTKKALTRADEILAERARITKAVEREVSELGPLIEARIVAENAAASIAAEASLSGIEAADSGDTAIQDAVERIRKQSVKLRGLRELLHKQAVELGAAHTELRAAMPEYEASIREAFLVEWNAAIQGLEQVLARRRTLELELGKAMELPALPRAAAAGNVGDCPECAPHQVLRKLSEGLASITGWAALSESSIAPHPSLGVPAAYDPQGVYELVRPFDNVAAGSRVTDASFPSGILAWLAASWEAVPLRPDRALIWAAQQAQRQIADASRPEAEAGTPLPAEVLERSREAQRINERDAARANPDKATRTYERADSHSSS